MDFIFIAFMHVPILRWLLFKAQPLGSYDMVPTKKTLVCGNESDQTMDSGEDNDIDEEDFVENIIRAGASAC